MADWNPKHDTAVWKPLDEILGNKPETLKKMKDGKGTKLRKKTVAGRPEPYKEAMHNKS